MDYEMKIKLDWNAIKEALQKAKKLTKKEKEKLARVLRKEEEQIKKLRERENKQVERNLKGIELARVGKINQAIKLYEQNVKENFVGDHPYGELAFFYKNTNKIADEIRVLRKAVWVFDKVVYKKRGDRLPKLKMFQKMLKEAKKVRGNCKHKKNEH